MVLWSSGFKQREVLLADKVSRKYTSLFKKRFGCEKIVEFRSFYDRNADNLRRSPELIVAKIQLT